MGPVCSDNVTEADCLAASGTWQGEGTTCSDVAWVYVATITATDVSAATDVVLAAQPAGDYLVRYAAGAYGYWGSGAWSAHGFHLVYGGGNTGWIVQPPPGSSQTSAAVAQAYYSALPGNQKTHYFNHSGGDMTLRFADSYYGDNDLGAAPPQFEIWKQETVDISCCDLAVTMADTALTSTDGESVAATLSAAVITGGIELGRTIVWERLRNNGVTETISDPTASSNLWPVGVTWMRLKVTDTNGCYKWVNFKVTVTAGGAGICPDDCRGSDTVTLTWTGILTDHAPTPWGLSMTAILTWFDSGGVDAPLGYWYGTVQIDEDNTPGVWAPAAEVSLVCEGGQWVLTVTPGNPLNGQFTASLQSEGSSCDPSGTYGSQAGSSAYGAFDFTAATVTIA